MCDGRYFLSKTEVMYKAVTSIRRDVQLKQNYFGTIILAIINNTISLHLCFNFIEGTSCFNIFSSDIPAAHL